MKNLLILCYLFLCYLFFSFSYPIIYCPGMFDNGDLFVKDSLLVKNLNDKMAFSGIIILRIAILMRLKK